MTRGLLSIVLAAWACVSVPAAQTGASKTLDIYVVDVEGGNATLFVSPSGESVLIDSGRLRRHHDEATLSSCAAIVSLKDSVIVFR